MANTVSDVISNILAGTKNAAGAGGGEVSVATARVVSVSGNGSGHLYPLFRVPAQARLFSLRCNNTADAGWTDINVNVYAGNAAGTISAGNWNLADQTAVTGGASKLVDAQNRASASAGADELLGFGTAAYDEALEGLPLWQVIGLSADPGPGVMWDLVMESVGDPAGGGTAVWTMLYNPGGV